MDLADHDLENYQLARQLHMITHLYEVFLTNTMCYPLFYESLHPSAKQQARTVLLALHRVFEKGESGGSALFTRSPYRLYTLRCILSYLAYPDCAIEWPRYVSRQIASSANEASSIPVVTMEVYGTPQCTATGPHSLDATPLRLDGSSADNTVSGQITNTTINEGNPAILTTPAVDTASSATPSPLQQPQQQRPSSLPPPLSPPIPSNSAAVPTAVADVLLRPLFYIRPLNTATVESAPERILPFFGTTTQIYVRMVHPHLLNEESLNPYFGRYGQVDCTAIQRTPLRQYAVYLGEAVTEALHQLFAATNTTDASSLYVQDFIISVDSHQNAVHAVRRAYYKELVCIALHDSTGVKNTHCLADVNKWMQHHAFVWRLHAEVPLSAGERELAANAEAAAAATRRKRSRAKHGLRARKRIRRAVLGKAEDSGSSVSSSSAASENSRRNSNDKDGDSSESESDSSSSSSSGSSNTSNNGSTEDDLAQFVPDVVLDGFPYWTTEDQLKVLLQDFGTVVEMRLSLDDMSGAFTGCVLVRMSTLEEAVHVSRALHDKLYRGYRLISGVINERLEVVALEDGEEVRALVAPELMPYDVSLNERVWV